MVPELISERDAYERWPLGARELRQARQARLIGYYRRKGGFYYTEAQIAAYLEHSRVDPQPEAAEKSASVSTIDLTQRKIPGLTPELEAGAARLLARQVLKPPKTRRPAR